ncbi:MAG: hypothetical protein A2806_04055 [Candidatus Terrybacteria bacterium RIFCSPHIGHO2_01_FULL_48_17]|uniref:NadR/Ttd14 AAA domain-containing protein n=1 Tax=Candidatus Terrybacteria bacterium RIFCSPHIGHO2_01_FULL_48_17 TaxID=1802362 RepID=A0A1G2PMK8_9BACT|nr:MAG: hypothetical protein A2806_04055 [Candidatus Terrybacteria bacterium RIFCSPHIGHO2_01_FULL_48_17]OHA53751.1 MAG: hypothetical protein A3A30_05280 [Candidatus Terrybacteria bacterium RIFCSPLOWO2_01_FULL_48_14]
MGDVQVKIAVPGGPGSGKSTLVKLLSVALGDERRVGRVIASEAPVEYARTFIDRRAKRELVKGKMVPGRPLNVYDQVLLYLGQKRREEDLADYPILITDSPTFFPYVYFEEVEKLEGIIGDFTRDLIRRFLEQHAYQDAHNYDLILFAPPNIPFRTDPTRWQQDFKQRKRTSDRIEAFLMLNNVSYVRLRARSRQGRVREALKHIIPLLENELAPK